jgi:molecular chaperone DnaK (HSP70)
MNSTWQPHVDAIALPINIVVDYDNMHEVFERSRLYPCTANVNLTTYTNNQTAIVIEIYEGECRTTTDKCQFLGEFKLSGIPPHLRGVPKINATFTIDSNGILSVTASYKGEEANMTLDVYSKTGSMSNTKIDELSLLVRQLVSSEKPKCSLLENVAPITIIPEEPNKSNVLKLAVDSKVRFESTN